MLVIEGGELIAKQPMSTNGSIAGSRFRLMKHEATPLERRGIMDRTRYIYGQQSLSTIDIV
jgi:hypothetical protein